ncbi:thiamine pyrophosphate-dependent enzyme [Desulfobacula sp.]
MSLLENKNGLEALLMGNDAISRGALEAGVNVVTGYPGTPSSEIVEQLAKVAEARNLYVEWSVNEKVALEVAAAGSYARLKAMCVMKQVGVNVAADSLLHIAEYGTRGALVLVSCEDPGALSSTNEGDSRPYAKMMEFPLLEPGDFQEAKDMAKWAFELSEDICSIIMLRSVTRLSHASGNVTMGELPDLTPKAVFEFEGLPMDQMKGPILAFPTLVDPLRRRQLEKLSKAVAAFEKSPFNTYIGPEKPELLIIASSVCQLYVKEALTLLDLWGSVGLLKLGTTWPLPPRLLEKYLKINEKILIVEEGTPFLEDNIKALAAEKARQVGIKTFFGRKDRTLPPVNELNPDLLIQAINKIMGGSYQPVSDDYKAIATQIISAGAPTREMTFCPGCPHRASFWLIHNVLKLDNRKGFLCGDIGCYSLGAGPCGFSTIKILHAMGSGIGMASGFGKFSRFGFDQPVMAVCGDSTFFHAVMPALANAVHNQSNMILVVLDNSGTAMTGFQPHPGTPAGATGTNLPMLNIEKICQAMGVRVEVSDPFDLKGSQRIMLDLLEDEAKPIVLILKQPCALSPEKKGKKKFEMTIDETQCLADQCGCNRLCTRVFKCPGLIWDTQQKKTQIDEVLCTGCGVCADICPTGAIIAQEVR